jgi:hypothetical protein
LMSASANRLTPRFVFPLIAIVGRCYQSSRFYRYSGDCLAWPALFAVAMTWRRLWPLWDVYAG